MQAAAFTQQGPLAGEVLDRLRSDVDEALEELLNIADETGLDPLWGAAQQTVKAYALRPAKRVRPVLLLAGYALAKGELRVPPGLVQFAAGLELLHTFLLVHDDIADRATERRGGPALHLMLGAGKAGEDLAVVAGDHLYSRALEAMLASGLPRAAEAVRYMLAICRHTAVGQHLDLELSRAPLPNVTLFQALKVANLKTAKYGFVAPLVCGAMLAGAEKSLVSALERVGRHAGVAFQLTDDLLGLFGDDRQIGKAGGGDYFEAKRTFPVLAAWTRADDAGRERLEALWSLTHKDAAGLSAARAEVLRHGGKAATERAIARAHRRVSRSLELLPEAGGVRRLIEGFFTTLSRRTA